MVFSSLTFIFFFIPVTAIAYFISPSRVWRNGVLLAASLVFYSWGEPRFLVLMLLTAGVAWAGGLVIDRTRSKAAFILTVVLIVSGLFVFKYLNFAADNLGRLLGTGLAVPKMVLPLGISFYTFQILSYVIDLWRGKVKVQKNYLRLLLYVSFFPQLIAGPIVRYSDIEQEIGVRYENAEEISGGIKRFIAGLAKKVIIANGVAKIAELVYAGGPESFGRLGYWLAALAYTLQIYFDFSGYSDMAIGLGRIFGFHFPENFDHPYISTSVTEFWRRWHISLSSWFRDYIYIPLGGNRVGRGRWIFNIMAVWTLTGLWHGASWNFILWGLYYGLILLFEKLVLGKLLSKLPKIFGWVYTMFVVVIGWVLFDISDFAQLSAALTAMFKGPLIPAADMVAADVRIAIALIYVPLGLIFMFPVGRLFKNFEKRNAGLIVSDIFFAALLVLCVAVLISDSYNPFIYFRF